jgi:hypothetical protein
MKANLICYFMQVGVPEQPALIPGPNPAIVSYNASAVKFTTFSQLSLIVEVFLQSFCANFEEYL